MSDDSQAWLDTALPLDDVGSNRIELAGRLAEFVARLESAADALTGTRPLTEWIEALTNSVAQLTRVGPGDAWQEGQLQREFSEVLTQAGSHTDTKLRLPDVRALLSGHLAGRPTRANFRTGTLTVCTMVPMRSVPHRVICLVGLDDGVFPRIDVVDGDDALARCPMTGERDIRSEDRQLLLDAVCAAGETLVITYTGSDEHTGHPRPPAVPLAELLDALDQTTESPVRQHIVTHHPLQPFDRKNVTPGALGVPGKPFTFDPTALAAAEAAAGKRTEPPRVLHHRCCRHRSEMSNLPICWRFSSTRSRASSERWTTRCPGMSTASKTPCQWKSTTWSSGSSAIGCCTTCCAVCIPRPPHTPSGDAAPCLPGGSAARWRATSATRRASSLRRHWSTGRSSRRL